MKTINSATLNQAQFVCSAHTHHEWPIDSGSEIAVAGRSNVGKSSAINAITGRTGLARTSKTPGRTRQIVFFDLTPDHRLVDLPGYGFARTSHELRQHWQKTINRYFSTRKALRGLILPIDIRRGLMAMDQEMLNWCRHHTLPVHLLLTKRDKLSRSAAQKTMHTVQKQLVEFPLFSAQLFSATKKEGVEEARAKIVQLLMSEPRPVNN